MPHRARATPFVLMISSMFLLAACSAGAAAGDGGEAVPEDPSAGAKFPACSDALFDGFFARSETKPKRIEINEVPSTFPYAIDLGTPSCVFEGDDGYGAFYVGGTTDDLDALIDYAENVGYTQNSETSTYPQYVEENLGESSVVLGYFTAAELALEGVDDDLVTLLYNQ